MTLATPKDSKVWIGMTFVFALFLTFEALHTSCHLVEKVVLAPSDDFIDTSRWSKAMLRASRLRMFPPVMDLSAEEGSTSKPRQLRRLDSDASSPSNRSSEARVDDSSSEATMRAYRSRTSPTATDSNEEGEPMQQQDSLSDSGSSSGSDPSDTYILDSSRWSEAMRQASRSRMDPTATNLKGNKGCSSKLQLLLQKLLPQQQDHLLEVDSSSGSFRPHRRRKCCTLW